MDHVAARGGVGQHHRFPAPAFHPFYGGRRYAAQQQAPFQQLLVPVGGNVVGSGMMMMPKQQEEELVVSDTNNGVGIGTGEHQVMAPATAVAEERRQLVMRRPRGRPVGSKNKPKPPVIIAGDVNSALRAHILEVATGRDIIDSVATFARRRQVGVCVLSATGAVANLSIVPGGAGVVNLPGRFDIVSLSGSFLPPPAPPSATALTLYVSAGMQGQVIGGTVAGALVASGGPVVIVAGIFANASYERLPIDVDDEGHSSSPPQIPLMSSSSNHRHRHLMNGIQLPNDDDNGYGHWTSSIGRVAPY